AQFGSTSFAGGKAFAIVSNGDIVIRGLLALNGTASPPPGQGNSGGPGCSVGPSNGDGNYPMEPVGTTLYAGGGGGTFASYGGTGGVNGSVAGGKPGNLEGGYTLQPLRGGCLGGFVFGPTGSVVANAVFGGGAVQLVSRTSILVEVSGTSHGVINVGGAGGS